MKLENDYTIIETVSEASCFGEEAVTIFLWKRWGEYKRVKEDILEAITPKEGDAVFFWDDEDRDDVNPEYDTSTNGPSGYHEVKANALTIGKTVGELRALLEWAREEK